MESVSSDMETKKFVIVLGFEIHQARFVLTAKFVIFLFQVFRDGDGQNLPRLHKMRLVLPNFNMGVSGFA